MYLIAENRLDDATLPSPSGPEFNAEQVKNAVRMEVWGSSFTDHGPDFTLFKLIGPDGNQIAEKRVSGY